MQQSETNVLYVQLEMLPERKLLQNDASVSNQKGNYTQLTRLFPGWPADKSPECSPICPPDYLGQ